MHVCYWCGVRRLAPSCDITTASLSPRSWINDQTQSSLCLETENCDPALALPPSPLVFAVVIMCSLKGSEGKLYDYRVNKLYLKGKINLSDKQQFSLIC